MTKKHYHKDECCCCCQPCCPQNCCCNNNNNNNGGCCGNPFSGINSCVAPIIFLLIACGSGLLCSGSSYLIILLFLLCGGCGSFLVEMETTEAVAV